MFGVAISIIWVIERFDRVAMGHVWSGNNIICEIVRYDRVAMEHVWSGNIYNEGDRKIC